MKMGTTLLKHYLLYCGFILLLTSAIGLSIQRALVSEYLAADLALARSFATGPEGDFTAFPSAYAVFLVSAAGDVQLLTTVDRYSPPDHTETWLQQVLRSTSYVQTTARRLTFPNGDGWLLAAVERPDVEGHIAVLRPNPLGWLNGNWLLYAMLALVAVALIGGFSLWLRVSRTLIDPLVALVDVSEVLRWRGHLRVDEQTQLDSFALKESEVGRLAIALTALGRETQRRLTEMSTLLEAGRTIASSLDVEQVLDGILQQVQEVFHVQRCAVLVLDERSGLLRIRVSCGLSGRYARQLRVNPAESGSAPMRALRNRTPVQIADTETELTDSVFRTRAREEGYRSVLAIPLHSRHARQSVLALYKTEPYRYSYGELELASSFGNYMSVALENAALFARSDEHLQEQTRRLDAIVESLRDGLVLEGLDGDVLYCNQRAADLLDIRLRTMQALDGAGIVDRMVASAQSPDDVSRLYERALSENEGDCGMSGGQDDNTFDVARRLAPGMTQHLRIHLFNVTDAQGHRLGRGQLWQDITQDKELERMKSALLSTVSHELRTPLATIKGYASTLLAADVNWDAESQQEFIEIISTEADRLAELVRNLLDMSRIEAGMLKIHREPYSLNDLATQVVDRVPSGARGRIKLDLDPWLLPAPLDASRIETVIRNLVDNALKYSPPECAVEIMTKQGSGNAIFLVRDYGGGIAPEDRARVFERFYRSDGGLDRATSGVGLGLAICRGFVEAHGGTIRLDDVNSGTQVRFSLPVQAVVPLSNSASWVVGSGSRVN